MGNYECHMFGISVNHIRKKQAETGMGLPGFVQFPRFNSDKNAGHLKAEMLLEEQKNVPLKDITMIHN